RKCAAGAEPPRSAVPRYPENARAGYKAGRPNHLLRLSEERRRLPTGGLRLLLLTRPLPFPQTEPQSVRARSSTSNTSRLSPALMSLVSASITPHSSPARTSATSSLKRLSELIVVLETITSSRVRRALRPLRMTPSRTSRPAALSFLPAGKTSL